MTETQAQRAYHHLKNGLINGDYHPGSRIRYGPVGRELGISATPVREAIGQLATEGFVQLVPQLGAVVRQINRDELIELYEMREALEPYAAGRAAERIGETRLEEIRRQYARMQELTARVAGSSTGRVSRSTVRQFEQADLGFHMLIIEATGNGTMVRTVGNSHVLARIFSAERHGYDLGVMQSTCKDHRRILVALEQQDSAAAREAMSQHIRNSLEVTLAADAGPRDRWWEPS